MWCFYNSGFVKKKSKQLVLLAGTHFVLANPRAQHICCEINLVRAEQQEGSGRGMKKDERGGRK